MIKEAIEKIQEIDGRKPQTVSLKDNTGRECEVLVLPQPLGAMTAHSVKGYLDEYLDVPERKAGEDTFDTLESFIFWVQRHKRTESTLWAASNSDEGSASLTCLFDDHVPNTDVTGEVLDLMVGDAGWRKHTALYQFPTSKPYAKWLAISKQGYLSQTAFAELIEDRITDVVDPSSVLGGPKKYASMLACDIASPQKLMEMSRGLLVHKNEMVHSASNQATGEVELKFVSEHKDSTGAPMRVPGLFVVGIPIFEQGAPYQIAMRLRYRLKESVITWRVEPWQMDVAFDDAVARAVEQAAQDTVLQLLYGSFDAG